MADDALDQFAEKWLRLAEGRALVVGSKIYGGRQDRRTLYSEAVGVDLEDGAGVDLVHDCEEPLPAELGTFNHIDCVSVLEHVKRPWKLAENIDAVLNPGGTIFVCVPFVWRIHAYPSDYWRVTSQALDVLFPSIDWLSRKYASGPFLRKVVRGMKVGGQVWMQRSELVGFGRKCA